ncbi:sigma-70 family RNA polymerase sigma factor [Clostridium sardiniense]|uniref:Sigma-70 family RNA polymerase sigma factor n=1 Tax=Clostridium sardiniense TaxID=29369 RepID=A0ABS7KUG1_CLOSR|nr:sigma-70 family RNA polymerase sigma factor [Clostridium sardiniense]MBY0754453.1 sigma-70 family RNA polymerase sigma factor [Clostridium sardiniense]MDQ0460100.1 RNA polymerase sigma-70 factor (ECF subfamily) [Clostridium sardiniense]
MKIVEENFIEQLKKKNDDALYYVIDNYGWIIKTIVKKHLYKMPNYEDDCINDILMAVWVNIDKFDPTRSTFKNWLSGISKFKSIDYVRKYLKELEHANIDDLSISIKDESSYNIDRNELNDDLESLLSCLKEADKSLFLKLYVEEDDVTTISKETGIKKEIIYNRVSRGKKKLREIFRLSHIRGL